MDVNYEDFLFYLITKDTKQLKTLFNVLKDLSDDFSLNLTSNGIFVDQINNTGSMAIKLIIESSLQETYHCPNDFSIKVNVKSIYLIFDVLSSYDQMIFYIKSSDNTIAIFEANNHENDETRIITMNLLSENKDNNNDQIIDDTKNNDNILNIEYRKLKDLIGDFKKMNVNYLSICYKNNKYIFEGQDKTFNQRIVLSNKDNKQHNDYSQKYDMNLLLYCVKFPLYFLDNNIIIKLDDNKPLICEYNISIGILKLYIAPIDNDDNE